MTEFLRTDHSACTTPSRVCKVQGTGVNRAWISRTSLRAQTRRGWLLIRLENPGRALERKSGTEAFELTRSSTPPS